MDEEKLESAGKEGERASPRSSHQVRPSPESKATDDKPPKRQNTSSQTKQAPSSEQHGAENANAHETDKKASKDSEKKPANGQTTKDSAAGSTKESSTQKKSHPLRRWIWIIVPLMLIVGVGLFLLLDVLQKGADETHLELMGNIDVRQVNLAFKVEGRIHSLRVDEGDSVKANDVIAELDKSYFNDELRILRSKRDNQAANVAKLEHGSRPEEIAQAKAQTADREAALTKASEDYHRAEGLVNKGGVSRQEFDRYQSALNSAEAQLKAARESQRLVEIGPRQEDIDIARAFLAEQDAMIVQSERRLADADLVAPNDGMILTRARERGAIVQPGETVFALTLTSPVWVRTYVNEQDLGLIGPQMSAQVLTDSAPDHPYSGKIGFISPTAEFTPKSVETRERRTDLVYRLRVVVDNPDAGLRQGMPVTVRLELPQKRQRTFLQRVRDSVHQRFSTAKPQKQ
jgi:HlyD family secretion protein